MTVDRESYFTMVGYRRKLVHQSAAVLSELKLLSELSGLFLVRDRVL